MTTPHPLPVTTTDITPNDNDECSGSHPNLSHENVIVPHQQLTELSLQQHATNLNQQSSQPAHIPRDDQKQQLPPVSTQYAQAHDMDTITRAKACVSLLPPAERRQKRGSMDLPRQTILKALASRQIAGPHGITNFPSMSSQLEIQQSQPSSAQASPSITAQVANMQPTTTSVPPLALSSNFLRSPCFFHQRFESVVDIQKILDEIDEEDYSHSRLMQTATGVREVSKQLQRKRLKRAVRSVMIVTRARDNSLVHKTRELTEWLLSTPRYGKDVGVNVYVDAKLKHSKRFDSEGLLAKDPRYKIMLRYWTPDLCWSNPDKFDLVLTLGGDGTVLFTSWLFQRVVPPILSFALGSLGFLTNFEFDRYKHHLNHVMGDVGMRVNLRMRFTCTVWRSSADKSAVEEGEQFEVLNELVIDRGPSAYVSNLELYGDDELLTVVQADGCIFSTPTGSTAYSLSAGGSLIHPSIPAILLTPICPHTLSFRPMVLSDTLSLRIAVPTRSRSSAYCSFDGKGRIELKQGDYVTLEASQYPFPTVMTGTNEWVESVQRALRWNVRGAEQKGWSEVAVVDGEERDEDGEETWDIDIGDSGGVYSGTDSGVDVSEAGDLQQGEGGVGLSWGFGGKGGTSSPVRKNGMSLLNM